MYMPSACEKVSRIPVNSFFFFGRADTYFFSFLSFYGGEFGLGQGDKRREKEGRRVISNLPTPSLPILPWECSKSHFCMGKVGWGENRRRRGPLLIFLFWSHCMHNKRVKNTTKNAIVFFAEMYWFSSLLFVCATSKNWWLRHVVICLFKYLAN